MELPLGGPALRHYTQSRPRPHRQKLNYRPSRPQETIIESENEVLELMGRVDEGVEEFFTKKVLPTETQNKQDEDTITLHEVAPASSVPCPPPTKTLRRKLGDFFTLKKKRGLKSEPSQEGRPKKASIADLIRPLREVARSEKDKDRVKEHDKENEKEKVKPHPGAVPGDPDVQEPPVSSDAPLRGEAVPPRRALREGKSQSLILLSGSAAAAGTTNVRNTAKKPFEGQHSFEQKLHLMLQRIGVSKPQPGDTQNQEKEMKKAESEGTIIDSKPEPPSTFSKPRTMSASSDTRHQIRVSVSAHEAAGKPALLPKPVLKPGPPPTTSGRNTPENELAQIQEAETNTPTKLSPTTAPSAPTAPDLAGATPSTVPTISDSVPNAASVTVSPSSTVDTEVCTTEAATTPTDDAVRENKASVPKTTDTTVEPRTTSSESITPTSETKTPPVTTLETASDPNKQSPVSTPPTDLLAKATLPELNDMLTTDAAPDAESDADVSVTTAAPSSTTSTSDSALTGSEAGENTSAASNISETTVSKAMRHPSIPSDTITASVSQEEVPVPTSSTVVPTSIPPTTCSSSTTCETITPSSCDHMSSVFEPSNIQAALLSPDEIPAPSTSSSDTNPTDTTSTATSLNHADTTSTSSPAISAAISSSTASDPVSKMTPAGTESGGVPQLLTSPPPSNGSPCQNNDLQTSCEEEAKVEKAEKPLNVAEDKELNMIKNSESAEPEEKKETVLEEMKSENDKPVLDKSDLPRKEVQKESMKAEDDTVSEPGKEGEQSRDYVISEPQEQEGTLSVGEK